MRVTLDATKCEAYGACAEHCPSVFELVQDLEPAPEAR